MIGEGLVLDHEAHRYTVDGQRVGGVSEILKAVGVIDDRWFTPWPRDRGLAVHAACELLLQGRLDWSSVDSRIVGYVKAAAKFVAAAGITAGPVTAIERPVYHPLMRYAGSPDLRAIAFGDDAVIDWKSGGALYAHLATAAYEWAIRATEGFKKPLRRIAVLLREDGTFSTKHYTDANDYLDWGACVRIYNRYLITRKDRDRDGAADSYRAA